MKDRLCVPRKDMAASFDEYKEEVFGALKELRGSFENKHSDICGDTGALRDVIAIYDAILSDYICNPPQSKEEAEALYGRHTQDLSAFAPIAARKILAAIAEFGRLFPDGPIRRIKIAAHIVREMLPDNPIAKINTETKEICYELQDYILISRNFLAAYIGDPIKTAECYKNFAQLCS